MSVVIYKYPLDHSAEPTVKAPSGRLLKVAFQGNKLCAWIQHDLASPKVEWQFRIVMTGEEMPGTFIDMWAEWVYVDTLFYNDLVVHVFFRR